MHNFESVILCNLPIDKTLSNVYYKATTKEAPTRTGRKENKMDMRRIYKLALDRATEIWIKESDRYEKNPTEFRKLKEETTWKDVQTIQEMYTEYIKNNPV